MVGQAQPISIETLLRKQKEEKEAASRVSPPESAPFVLSGLTLTTRPPPAKVPHELAACGAGAC